MTLLTCALGPDAAGTVISDLCLGARHRLFVAVYECSLYHAWAFAVAHDRGAEVRVLLDAHGPTNLTTARHLGARGVACRLLGGGPGSEAHWKLLLADDAVAVGSGNLLRRDAPRPPLPPRRRDALPGTREWWAVVEGAPVVTEVALAAIDAAWGEASTAPSVVAEAGRSPHPAVPPVNVPRRLVAPLRRRVAAADVGLVVGGAAVEALLVRRLGEARRRLWCTVPYVHGRSAEVRRLLDVLAAAARRGAEVRLLLGTPPEHGDAAVLCATGLACRVMDPRRVTTGHAKGAVVDDAVVVGSANWSAAGLGGNREAALVVESPTAARWFAAALERDWRVSTPLG